MIEGKLYHWIAAEYFYKTLKTIMITNSISGFIAIAVILFLYKLWKKSIEANEILYSQLKGLESWNKNSKEDSVVLK